MSTFSITPERRKVIDFVTDFQVGIGFLTSSNSKLKISGPRDLCGLKAAVVNATVSEKYSRQFSKECVKMGKAPIGVQVYTQDSQGNLALQSRRADVHVSDSNTLEYAASQAPNKFKLQPFVYAKSPLAIGLPNNSPLAPALAAATNALIADGTYGKILAKWKANSIAITQSVIVK